MSVFRLGACVGVGVCVKWVGKGIAGNVSKTGAGRPLLDCRFGKRRKKDQ